MVSSLDRDLRKFKQQSELLFVTIQSAAKEPERWAKNTVITRNGKLVSVGGEVKPKEPPAFRVLSNEQMSAYLRGEIKNFGDLGKFNSNKEKEMPYSSETNRRYSSQPGKEANAMADAISSAKSSLQSAKDSIVSAFENLKNITATKFTEIWSDPKIAAIRKQIGDTLGAMGSKAKQAYTDTMKLFSDSVANFNKSESGKDYVGPKSERGAKGVLSDAKKAVSDAGKGFAESDTGKDVANAKKAADEFAEKMKKEVSFMATVAMENIQDAPDAAKGQTIAGVGAAMAAISGFMNAMASKADSAQVSGEFANNTKANLVKMLNKLSSQMASNPDAAIPSDVLKKMTQSIKNIDAGFQDQAEDKLDASGGRRYSDPKKN